MDGGSILDGIKELPQLASSDPLTPQQQLLKDQLNGLAPISYTDVSGHPAGRRAAHRRRRPGAGPRWQRRLAATQDRCATTSPSGTQQNPLGGLLGGNTYYVIALGGGKVRLALSASDAQHGNAITLTQDAQTGVNHKVTLLATAIFDTDPANDISDDSFQLPVSPGLFSYLYPQANFIGLTPVQDSTEALNVVGQHVTLTADGGSIGRSQAPRSST